MQGDVSSNFSFLPPGWGQLITGNNDNLRTMWPPRQPLDAGPQAREPVPFSLGTPWPTLHPSPEEAERQPRGLGGAPAVREDLPAQK